MVLANPTNKKTLHVRLRLDLLFYCQFPPLALLTSMYVCVLSAHRSHYGSLYYPSENENYGPYDLYGAQRIQVGLGGGTYV
jgi:hypothetical protein